MSERISVGQLINDIFIFPNNAEIKFVCNSCNREVFVNYGPCGENKVNNKVQLVSIELGEDNE